MILAPHVKPPRCAMGPALAPGRVGLGARRFARARRLRRGWRCFAGVRLMLLRRAPTVEQRAADISVINVGVRLSWSPSWTVVRAQGGPAAGAGRLETAASRAPAARRRAPAGVTLRHAAPGAVRILRRGAAADLERGAPVLRIVRAAVRRGEEVPAPARGGPEAPEPILPPRTRRAALARGEPPSNAGGAAGPAARAPQPAARGKLRVEERGLAAGRRRVVRAPPERRAEAAPAPAPPPPARSGRAAATAAVQAAARAAIDVEALTADVVRRIDRRVTAWRERTGRL